RGRTGMSRVLASTFALFVTLSAAAQVDPSLFREMRWRMIGPFRGGRTVAECCHFRSLSARYW
ncbi:MAG: hypothetical protein ACXW2F_09615, partial [Thermoanaerobaculia bacterium]